ncbi:hypothetical protein GCM10009549_18280 [Streptomyces thermoalcalitolerans]|uniref:Uncharacterized protein n=1 Tax=Streptomyces thermoalcalitolerans TaxID=65605 RepID=A0ABN1NIY6_9ACTN
MSLPPKLKVTFVPGWSFSNFLPRAVKLSLSEAAAKTVTSPDGFDDEEADAAESEPGDEQALRAMRATAPVPVT